jgi:high-affinity iron transporter
MMGNSLFIVWRESVEAMLVISILHTWLKRNEGGGAGMRSLWAGVAVGIGLAMALGWLMMAAQSELAGEALEWFQIAMLFIAGGLIAQMVLWMHKHGREMKQGLEQNLAHAVRRSGGLGIATVAALALAREGAETVIFLYGMSVEENGIANMVLGGSLGLALALLTAWAINRGLRFLNYRHFFRVSGVLLLLFAVALLVSGTERVIGMGILPALIDPVWDTSMVLDDSSSAGALLSAFTGYRARPSLMLLMVYAGYWVAVMITKRRLNRHV